MTLPENPLFLQQDYRDDEKPRRYELVEGAPVVVVKPSWRPNISDTEIEAVITSTARIWAVITEADIGFDQSPRVWRLRLDDQTDGGDSVYAVRFRTPYQHRFIQAWREARSFLASQGLIPASGVWTGRNETIELARLIWPHRK